MDCGSLLPLSGAASPAGGFKTWSISESSSLGLRRQQGCLGESGSRLPQSKDHSINSASLEPSTRTTQFSMFWICSVDSS